jgi:hypothetical protein
MPAQTGKDIIDGIAVTTTIGSLASWLPPTASLFTIIWLLIRIYESKTVQDLLDKKPSKGENRGKVRKRRSKNTDHH